MDIEYLKKIRKKINKYYYYNKFYLLTESKENYFNIFRVFTELIVFILSIYFYNTLIIDDEFGYKVTYFITFFL